MKTWKFAIGENACFIVDYWLFIGFICCSYEVHVEEQCRSKGLGKFLLQLLELLCHRLDLQWQGTYNVKQNCVA